MGLCGNLASGHPQSTQSPCMTPGPLTFTGIPPTVATRHPSWMSLLENVSATFLWTHLGATSSIQGIHESMWYP